MLHSRGDKSPLVTYIYGLAEGADWTNIAAQSNGRKPLFCIPENAALHPQLAMRLLDDEIRTPTSGKMGSLYTDRNGNYFRLAKQIPMLGQQ